MNSILFLLSKNRSAIMGFAIMWIMLFHFPTRVGFFPIDLFRSIGYGGVDIFLFLSGFGLYFSMSKKNFDLKTFYKNRFIRILPEFWFVLCVSFLIQMDFTPNAFYALICRASTLGYWIWGGACLMSFGIFHAYCFFMLYIHFILRCLKNME